MQKTGDETKFRDGGHKVVRSVSEAPLIGGARAVSIVCGAFFGGEHGFYDRLTGSIMDAAYDCPLLGGFHSPYWVPHFLRARWARPLWATSTWGDQSTPTPWWAAAPREEQSPLSDGGFDGGFGDAAAYTRTGPMATVARPIESIPIVLFDVAQTSICRKLDRNLPQLSQHKHLVPMDEVLVSLHVWEASLHRAWAEGLPSDSHASVGAALVLYRANDRVSYEAAKAWCAAATKLTDSENDETRCFTIVFVGVPGGDEILPAWVARGTGQPAATERSHGISGSGGGSRGDGSGGGGSGGGVDGSFNHLTPTRGVDPQELREYAAPRGIVCIEASCSTTAQIHAIMTTVAQVALSRAAEQRKREQGKEHALMELSGTLHSPLSWLQATDAETLKGGIEKAERRGVEPERLAPARSALDRLVAARRREGSGGTGGGLAGAVVACLGKGTPQASKLQTTTGDAECSNSASKQYCGDGSCQAPTASATVVAVSAAASTPVATAVAYDAELSGDAKLRAMAFADAHRRHAESGAASDRCLYDGAVYDDAACSFTTIAVGMPLAPQPSRHGSSHGGSHAGSQAGSHTGSHAGSHAGSPGSSSCGATPVSSPGLHRINEANGVQTSSNGSPSPNRKGKGKISSSPYGTPPSASPAVSASTSPAPRRPTDEPPLTLALSEDEQLALALENSMKDMGPRSDIVEGWDTASLHEATQRSLREKVMGGAIAAQLAARNNSARAVVPNGLSAESPPLPSSLALHHRAAASAAAEPLM